MDFGQALQAARARVLGNAVQAPESPIASIDQRDPLTAWLQERALSQVEVTEHDLQIPLDEELAWLLVRGSGWRRFVEELPASQRQDLRDELVAELERRGVHALDAGTLIGTGLRTGHTPR